MTTLAQDPEFFPPKDQSRRQRPSDPSPDGFASQIQCFQRLQKWLVGFSWASVFQDCSWEALPACHYSNKTAVGNTSRTCPVSLINCQISPAEHFEHKSYYIRQWWKPMIQFTESYKRGHHPHITPATLTHTTYVTPTKWLLYRHFTKWNEHCILFWDIFFRTAINLPPPLTRLYRQRRMKVVVVVTNIKVWFKWKAVTSYYTVNRTPTLLHPFYQKLS